MPVVLITSVSPSGNLVTTKKFQGSKTSSNLFENNITDNNNITITTNNNDIDMTKSLINNGQNSSSMGNIEYITNFETFNERTYDDDKSSYHYNNFTNHNINKIVTEKNANENLNFKNNANLISIHENSIYTTTSSSISSSISSSFSSSFLSSSPESNVNNIINNLSMQHITTTSPNMINTVHLNQNIYDNNIIDNNSSVLGTKSNEIDRVIISDDKNRLQPCLRKQQSPSKIQRLKRTFSLSKKSDREVEELEQGEEEVINTYCDNRLSLFATATPPSTLKENYPFRLFTMSRDSGDVLDNSNNSSNHSTYKKFPSSTITISTKKSTPCVCNDNIRKRVKSNSIHHCPILPSTISLTSLVDDSSSKDSSMSPTTTTTTTTVADMIIPESRESHDHPSKIKARNSMDDQTEFDIRRSWSHIEVRHLKGLFSRRNRHSSDVQRRNSYAYTNSQRANRQTATESEFKVLNNVHKFKKTNLVNEECTSTTPTTPATPTTPTTPTSFTSSTSSTSSTPTTSTSSTSSISSMSSTTSDVEQSSQSSPKKFLDIFALQADMEKEPDGITRSRQMRKFIISEIYSTEQSYLSHMKTLKKTFMDPCINSSTSPPLVNKDDIRIIFAHLDDLVKLSDKFVETIETSMDPREVYDSKLGQVFLDFAEGFEVYKKYAENIQRSRQLLTKKVNQSVFYRRFVSAQRKKENIKLSLSDYLIMPIQRVARYALLLKDLKKYTIETHSDYNDLCKALDFMVFLAKECNNNIQDI